MSSTIDVTASVDPVEGAIILPVERYLLSQDEIVQIIDAGDLAVSKCVAEAGEVYPWSPTVREIGGDRRYGVWVMAEVEQFGYDLPTTPEKDEALADNSKTPTVDVALLESCAAKDASNFAIQRIQPTFDYNEEFGGVTDEVLASDEGREVFADWEACLATVGLQRDRDSQFALLGATVDVTEQNIAMAISDVQCKTEVDFVARLAGLEAARQAPVVSKYVSELTEMRAEYDAMVAAAHAYLTANAP